MRPHQSKKPWPLALLLSALLLTPGCSTLTRLTGTRTPSHKFDVNAVACAIYTPVHYSVLHDSKETIEQIVPNNAAWMSLNCQPKKEPVKW